MNTPELHVILGTGPLGLSVMRELVARGKCVRMVNRSGSAPVPAGVEVVRADAYNAADVRRVIEGAAVVYQCAQPAYTEWVEKFPPLQAAIVEGVSAHSGRLVVGDNLYMYGRVKGAITESLPYNPHTKKGKVRAAMADALMEAHESGRLRVAVGRASDFYGAAALNSAVGERVFYPALAGKNVGALGNLDAPHTYTFMDDFGKALVVLGAHDEAYGQTWHVPSGETLTTRQFLTLVFEEAGQKPNVSGVPTPVLRLVSVFSPPVREVIEMLYQFEEPHVMDSSKFTRAFGDTSTPTREAIRRTLEWYRANPKQR